MDFFRRLALQPFLKAHPPQRRVAPAPADLIAEYDGVLPSSLLALWRRKGLGFYGERQLALIDPRAWRAVLDRWIVSAPDDVRRTPIALTPFGVILYHRQLTPQDEDIAYIDPVSKKTGDLAWSLDDFFNGYLCDRADLDALVDPDLLASARQACGPLAPGQVYEIDQMLLSMQMLKIAKADALELHQRLRDAVDPPRAKAGKPATVGQALPAAHRATFENVAAGPGLQGLYLSSYIDWHRLLALRADGQYRLLFWRIHHKTFERLEVRAYAGAYSVSRSAAGDHTVALDIALGGDSLGSDANDAQLTAMVSGGTTFLLRTDELEDMANAIEGRQVLGRSEYYFRSVTLDDAFADEPSEGRAAPPADDLPQAVRALIRTQPLRPTITHVDAPDPGEEDDGEGVVMCTLDLGEADGLRMNMPLYSPPETGRGLTGWVWQMDARACRAGIRYQRAEGGDIVHGPAVGDVLTTRAP